MIIWMCFFLSFRNALARPLALRVVVEEIAVEARLHLPAATGSIPHPPGHADRHEHASTQARARTPISRAPSARAIYRSRRFDPSRFLFRTGELPPREGESRRIPRHANLRRADYRHANRPCSPRPQGATDRHLFLPDAADPRALE